MQGYVSLTASLVNAGIRIQKEDTIWRDSASLCLRPDTNEAKKLAFISAPHPRKHRVNCDNVAQGLQLPTEKPLNKVV